MLDVPFSFVVADSEQWPNVVGCEINILAKIFNTSAVPPHVRPVTNPHEPTIMHVSFELKTVMDMVCNNFILDNKPRYIIVKDEQYL